MEKKILPRKRRRRRKNAIEKLESDPPARKRQKVDGDENIAPQASKVINTFQREDEPYDRVAALTKFIKENVDLEKKYTPVEPSKKLHEPYRDDKHGWEELFVSIRQSEQISSKMRSLEKKAGELKNMQNN